MSFDFQSMIQSVDLSSLDTSLSEEEIETVITELPHDKYPRNDGFNGLFIKKCWPIIKSDFNSLISAFYSGHIDLRSINSSFITLMPKIQSPSSVNDFRPISLLWGPIKLLTKLLANRVQSVVTRLVHTNQYGFIK
jgi:hypothetical protein